MATARVGMAYDAPSSYAELIAPRYAPIADALVKAARLRPSDDVLELGAGTGLVTSRAVSGVRSVVATDLAAGMLDVARRSIGEADGLTFVLVDYDAPLPFLPGSFDLVLSGLTYVQDKSSSLKEVARVLKPSGRLALAMWGPAYQELRILADAVQSIGRPRIPSPSPLRVMRRLGHAGFGSIKRRDFDLTNEFESVDDYITYRRGFGVPATATRSFYERYLAAVRRRASDDAAEDGHLTLGWTLTIITARRERGSAGPNHAR